MSNTLTTTSGPGTAPRDCQTCAGAAATKPVFDKFDHTEYGHLVCTRCGITFDSNVNDLLFLEFSADEIRNISDESEYRRLFVETSKIADKNGTVYADFDWDDNDQLKAGVAKHVVDVIRRHACNFDGLKILDLGCGNGFTALELASDFGGENVTAVDPSPEVNHVNGIEGVRAIQGTLDSLRFSEDSFDVVVIIGNLMLHNNPRNTLAEARRILRTDGLLIIDFKNVNSLIRRACKTAARFGVVNLIPRRLLERAFVNMRFGFDKAFMRKILDPLGFSELENYSKPPRLLEFDNAAALQSGIKGLIWRVTDKVDQLTDQRAWVQMVWRKR